MTVRKTCNPRAIRAKNSARERAGIAGNRRCCKRRTRGKQRMEESDRAIALIDMDCFYAQVEQREARLWGKPVIVVQPSGPNGALGGSIAVSYEARKKGVRRGMLVPEATALCPDVHVRVVPFAEHVAKPDIGKYRDASAEVFEVLNNFDARIVVEKASVDEAFLDLTQVVKEAMASQSRAELIQRYLDKYLDIFATTWIADGNDTSATEPYSGLTAWIKETCAVDSSHLMIAIAGEIVEQIREAIEKKTKFHCSAGVATNKMMAKLVCARHKPGHQTLAPKEYYTEILFNTPIRDVRGLGGRSGKRIIELLDIETMGQLAYVPYNRLVEHFPKNLAACFYQMSRGVCPEQVVPRQLLSSIATSKEFPGKRALTNIKEIREWLHGLSKELSKRLANDQSYNARTARTLVVGWSNSITSSTTRQIRLNSYHADDIFEVAWSLLSKANASEHPDTKFAPEIGRLSVFAKDFEDGVSPQVRTLSAYIVQQKQTPRNPFYPNQKDEPPPYEPILDSDGWEVFDVSQLVDVDPVEFDPDQDQPCCSKALAPNSGPITTKDLYDMNHVDNRVLKELPKDIIQEMELHTRLTAVREAAPPLTEKTRPAKRGKKKAVEPLKNAPPTKKITAFFKT